MARAEGPPTLPEPLRRRLVSFSSSVFSDSARTALGDVPRAAPGFPGYRAGTAPGPAALAGALSLFSALFLFRACLWWWEMAAPVVSPGGTCGSKRALFKRE